MSELYDAFSEYFKIVPAKTPTWIERSLRLRYQVYCLERGFEDPREHPDELETDAYDSRSAHSVLWHRRTQSVVGTVRLILPDPEQSRPFPIEVHCGASFRPSFDPTLLPRGKVAEISRFAISKEFRRRRDDSDTPHGLGDGANLVVAPESERRVSPHITIGLFRATLQMSVENGIEYWYAVMEPTLYRLLRRFGVLFEPIGEDVDYHGLRRPCLAKIEDLLANMWRNRPDVWGFMTGDGALWPRDCPADAHPVYARTAGLR